MDQEVYLYKIHKVVKVVDGDTIDVVIDLGFNIRHKTRVRLMGINAPESRTKDKNEKVKGLAAKKRLTELCGKGNLLLKSHGKGKYGRVLGEFFASGVNLNNVMVAEGHAVEYYGGKR